MPTKKIVRTTPIGLDDEANRALEALRLANYNTNGVVRRLIIQFAVEKGVLSDDKKANEEVQNAK